MSIEIVGPEKYELQDLVCLALALRFNDAKKVSIFVEPRGREDALLQVSDGRRNYEIEVQVKGSDKAVELSSIAEWLTHFPGRSAKNCLLERLSRSTRRFVLLVVSGRCSDSAARFTTSRPWRLTSHNPNFLRLRDSKDFLQLISNQYANPQSSLEQARQDSCKALAQRTSPAALRCAATRLIVEELVTMALARTECAEILRERFLIPDDRLELVINSLAAVIRDTKYESLGSKDPVDANLRLGSLLGRFAERSVRPQDYVARGDEAAWRHSLVHAGVLLLSGRPRCGKSYAARYAASEFQTCGYQIKEGTEPDDALRWLLDGSSANRLYILDDPLGPLQPYPDAFRRLETLRWLLQRLHPNQKLIVAQSQDQLFETTARRTLPECAFGSVRWHDLSLVPAGFLADAWNAMSEQSSIRQDIQTLVEPALRDGSLEVEIGCLRHLASNADELPENPSTVQIIELARQDARNLGVALAGLNSGMMQLLMALSIASSPGKPLNRQELAFLLQEGNPSLPGKRTGGTAFILGGQEELEQFPTYGNDVSISGQIDQQIDMLERRHFVEVFTNGDLQFAHPYYRAAAQSVYEGPTSVVAKHSVKLFERALFSLSPITGSAAARNAESLINALVDHSEERRQVFKVVQEGMHSIFPIVRDLCFVFLIQHADELDSSFRDDRYDWIQSATSISLKDVQWHSGQAWIPSQRGMLDSLTEEYKDIDEARIAADVVQLETGERSQVPPERAARVVQFYSRNAKSFSLLLASALLGYEEALIRARSARLWFAVERENDTDVVDRVFQDPHPTILLEVVKGCIFSWRELSDARQRFISQKLALAVQSEDIAVAILPLLVVFDRPEYTGATPPWPLFETLMPAVLSVLPHNIFHVGPRLYSVMESAVKACRPEAVVSICRSWIQWILREVSVRAPSDYELGVADILVAATRGCPSLRQGMIEQLLSIPPTELLIYFVRDLQAIWPSLTDVERDAFIQLTWERRPDSRWLSAVVLTRRSVPPELQTLVLGRNDALQLPASELMLLMPQPLLEAAIAVQCGRPGVFWNIAHSSEKFDEVVRLVELVSGHIMFETAFHDAVLSMDDARVTAIVLSARSSDLNTVFGLLLNERIDWTDNFLPNAWSALLARGGDRERGEWFQRMAAAAPACIDTLTDVPDWLICKDDQHTLVQLLPGDVVAQMRALRLSNSREKSEKEYVLQMLQSALTDDPPRLFGTCDFIASVLKQTHSYSANLSQLIASARKDSFAAREAIEAACRSVDDLPTDWIGIAHREP